MPGTNLGTEERVVNEIDVHSSPARSAATSVLLVLILILLLLLLLALLLPLGAYCMPGRI